MTQEISHYIGQDQYKLQLGLSAGEAISRWLRHQFPRDTAKHVARKTGLDPRTVENILDGHLSGTTLTKLLRAFRLELALPFIEAVLGASIQQMVERELEEIANDRAHIEAREQKAKEAWARLHARSAVDRGHLRLVAPGGNPESLPGSQRSGAVGDP